MQPPGCSMASVILMVTCGGIMPENRIWCTRSCPRSPVAITTRLTTRFITSVLSANPGKTLLLRLFSNYVFTLASTWLFRKYMAI